MRSPSEKRFRASLNAISLWNFKPDEIAPFPSVFEHANGRFLNSFRVVRPVDIESCLEEFPALRDNWPRISPWIVRSDLARLLYVYTHGDFYFDSDCEILRKFPKVPEPVVLFLEAILPSTSFLGPREDKHPDRRLRIANYAFGATLPRHPFFRDCIEECVRRLEQLDYTAQTSHDVLWVCGPDVITSLYHSQRHVVRRLDFGYVKHRAARSWR